MRARNQQRMRRLFQVQLFQKCFAQRVKRLQNSIANEVLLSFAWRDARTRIERLQRAPHVVQRGVRIEPDQPFGFASVAIDDAHRIDRLADPSES